MTPIVSQPLSALVLTSIFLLGAVLAVFANYCVDCFAWTPRYRSPWRRFPKELQEKGLIPNRTWFDRVPILGWIRLSRFAFVNASNGAKSSGKSGSRKSSEVEKGAFSWIPGWESRFFWVRPLLVETFFALLVVWRFQYWHNVVYGMTWGPIALSVVAWGVEVLFFWLALCASLVDLDDYVIPDAIMLPGAALGLCAAALCPALFAPPMNNPIVWPFNLDGLQGTLSVSLFSAGWLVKCGYVLTIEKVRLCVGLALTCVWSFWTFALLDRRFYLRLGIKRAFAIFMRRLRRSPLTPIVAALWTLGVVGIWCVVFKFASIESGRPYFLNPLDALSNAFVGLLVGTLLIWSVRILGGAILGVEAMGFGDVILTGMIGAFIGWQGVVVVFFLAPFFGLAFGLLRRFVNTDKEIPYGPFLCLATLLYVVCRERFSVILAGYLSDPISVLIIGGIGFVALAVALSILRIVKSLLRRG